MFASIELSSDMVSCEIMKREKKVVDNSMY